jgi:hypothetical protein
MNEAEAFGGGFWWAIHSASEIAFRWVPATIAVLSGQAPDGTVANPILTPITEPVTPADLAYFLQTTGAPSTIDRFATAWETYVAVSVLVSLFLAAAIIYCVMRILQIRYTEKLRFKASEESVLIKDVSKTQLRWNRILEQTQSDSDQNWRLAILEADIMLNELLDLQGYKGETMADKMKGVARGDFKTIDLAWEAHRMRNQVAHQGEGIALSSSDANRVIGLYRQVFREFRFIE